MEKLTQTIRPKKSVATCPICNSSALQEMLDFVSLPILSNVLWDQPEDALAVPRGDIRLVFCEDCGHVFNQVFNPRNLEYDAQYENSLHFSNHFQDYASWLANYLIDKYDLHGKQIIEIGSGKGEFLSMLCEHGNNNGIGFDPSYEPPTGSSPARLSFVKDLYSEKYASYQADLILSRHVLEHVYQPARFIQNMRQAIGSRNQVVVYCEVPNLGYILRDTAIWDIIYEHYSYFTARSLTELFTRNGFHILNLAEAFHEQFLYIEAAPRIPDHTILPPAEVQPVEVLTEQVASFAGRSREKLARWQNQLEILQAGGKRVVLWGAGSKGITFLNMLPARDVIEYVIDINPRKHNKFVTGAGQRIVPPEFLTTYRPDTIIIMNPAYQQEIRSTLDRLGLQVQILLAS